MTRRLSCNAGGMCVVFDLDDTLYKEIDFLKSGFRYISENISDTRENAERVYDIMRGIYESGGNVFEEMIINKLTDLSKSDLLETYRTHTPALALSPEAEEVLRLLKLKGIKLGVITDGRSITQRNKIAALGLSKYVDDENVIISEEIGSEKPSEDNYRIFMDKYPEITRFVYVGDNPKKDFIAPNILGWETIGLKDDGRNIHPQIIEDELRNPSIWINKITELLKYLKITE